MMNVGKEDETKQLKHHGHHSKLTGTESSGGDSDGLHADFSDTAPILGTIVASKHFGKTLAEYGRMGPRKRRQIKHGWNKVLFLLLLLVIGAFGGTSGGRRRTTDFNNVDSTDVSPQRPFKAHRERDRHVPDHFVSRLRTFFQVGGTIQRISDETGIARNNVVEGGASRCQDRSSGRGKLGFDAAHVVRLGVISPSIPKVLYQELEDLICHTQNVPRYANQGGIGRAVDNFQSGQALKELNMIDFSGQMTNKDFGIVNDIKNRYKQLFDNFFRSMGYKKLNEQEKRELQNARDLIDLMRPQALYDLGHAAYRTKMVIEKRGKIKQAKYEGYRKTPRTERRKAWG